MLSSNYYNEAIKALGLPYSNTCKFSQGEFIGCDEKAVTAKAEELYKKVKIAEDMDDLLSGMSNAEMLTLMFKYMGEKLAIATGGSSDAPTKGAKSITPTGEDLVVWGDRLSSELETKLIELRSI